MFAREATHLFDEKIQYKSFRTRIFVLQFSLPIVFQFRRNQSTDIELVKHPQETEVHYIYRKTESYSLILLTNGFRLAEEIKLFLP